MTECKYPGCDRHTGAQDRQDYRTRRFCSVEHDLKHEHLKADARDAQRAAEEHEEML